MPPAPAPVAAAAVRVAEEPVDRRYNLLSTIGEGSYGKALLAVRREDQSKVRRSSGACCERQLSPPARGKPERHHRAA